jgi:hypothetical protein
VRAIGFGPEPAAGDTDRVEDADVLVIDVCTGFGRGDHPGVHAQQAFDHRFAAGPLNELPEHRVERILRVP